MKKAMSESKLTLIFHAISSCGLIVILVMMFGLYFSAGDAAKENENRYNLTYHAYEFMDVFIYQTNEVRAYAATGKTERYDNYWNEVNVAKNREKNIRAMEQIGITEEEQEIVNKLMDISDGLLPLEEKAMLYVRNGRQDLAVSLVYSEQYVAAFSRINALKAQLLETLNERTDRNVQKLEERAVMIRIIIIAALIIISIVELMGLILIRRKVLRPLIKVRDQMGEIAQGNLSAKFTLEPNTSEIGKLAASIIDTKKQLKTYIKDIAGILGKMAEGNMALTVDNEYKGEFLPIQRAMEQILDSLNSTLLHIELLVGQVAEQAGNMSGMAKNLSSGTVEQASAVQEISSGIQDIAVQVENTSKDAEAAKNASMEAMLHLQTCDAKMRELTSTMEQITQSSNQIGGIIKTIEDISFQTNILALNASVEAARAGEAGKGFAVVAGEVQNLANKSAASAKDITELIENSIKQVQNGTALSSDTTDALLSLVVSAQTATEVVEQISESAVQQSYSLNQLKIGIEQIADVVQTNAATAEETAASAEELHSGAENMKHAVRQFKLRKN